MVPQLLGQSGPLKDQVTSMLLVVLVTFALIVSVPPDTAVVALPAVLSVTLMSLPASPPPPPPTLHPLSNKVEMLIKQMTNRMVLWNTLKGCMIASRLTFLILDR